MVRPGPLKIGKNRGLFIKRKCDLNKVDYHDHRHCTTRASGAGCRRSTFCWRKAPIPIAISVARASDVRGLLACTLIDLLLSETEISSSPKMSTAKRLYIMRIKGLDGSRRFAGVWC